MLRRSLIVSAILALAVAACDGSSDTASLEVITDGPGAGFGGFSTGGDKTFGFFLCVNDGPVELESIEAVGADGEVELLGGLVYTTADRFVGATDGYPPQGIDEGKIEPLEGAVVEIECVEPDSEERVQLLVGVDRTGSGGGQFDGFILHTNTDDVDIDYQILMCGDEREYCENLVPSTDT